MTRRVAARKLLSNARRVAEREEGGIDHGG